MAFDGPLASGAPFSRSCNAANTSDSAICGRIAIFLANLVCCLINSICCCRVYKMELKICRYDSRLDWDNRLLNIFLIP